MSHQPVMKEHHNGYRTWTLNGQLHREDGPAVEWADGTRQWWIDGQELTEEEFISRTQGNTSKDDQPVMKEYTDGTRMWCLPDGRPHREDGPAVERASGTRMWFLNGQQHREDGPAVEFASGTREWWVFDQELTEEEFNNYRFQVWVEQGRLIGQEENS